jgi:diacylglycerol kinase family enzyme
MSEPADRPPAFDPGAPLQFVINAASGSSDAQAKRAVIDEALAASGRSAQVLFCTPGELAATARAAAARAVAVSGAVVAVGGDGTLNTVAQAVHEAGGVMGVVPQGTFNYFARTHGIADDPRSAMRALLRAVPTPVQVAAMNGHVFLVNASLGLYPELLEDREAYKKRFGRSRWVALAGGIATLLRSKSRLKLHIELGDAARDVRTLTLFIGNNRLQLAQLGVLPGVAAGVPPGADAVTGEQGRITAVMLKPVGTWAMLRLLLHGAMGTLGDAPSIERFSFSHMVIRPSRMRRRRMVKVAFDGEVARMRAPLDVRVLERPLWLLTPRDGAAGAAAAGATPAGATSDAPSSGQTGSAPPYSPAAPPA